ncbi:putative phosphoglycerate mutase protein [Botrytis cinerea BcDW1]|uniref:Putative phosphoglycerate mutase protein n=1 Tax=Botryotinia fuckeliana (strain BcDW1) TaxID=1290391 RepID=M7TBN5_BOTF1|nr:putative phosphoglycerate mutase protein [Botrytis cinerea BcDW1]
MPPTIILIRHAQALHNVSNKAHNYELHDPALTGLGFGTQCDELASHLENEVPLAREIDLIVVSPMRRTLQTAQQVLGWLMKGGVPVILRPEWQESSNKPCDTGTPIEIMEKEWPQFDWSAVDPLFPAKSGLYEYSKDALTRRGVAARKWLQQRPEKVIAVVSHAAFLRTCVSFRQYANADYRIFDFADDDRQESAELVEREVTESNGGGLGKSAKGVFGMTINDYPSEIEKGIGEATTEVPK